jgi:putative nucleotidyltransferase with HDIG domain
MSNVSQQRAQRVATLFSGVLKGIHFYPASHPSILQPLRELDATLGELLREQGVLNFGVTDGTLYFADHLFVRPTPPVAELALGLDARGINAVTLRQGITFEQLSRFFILAADKKSVADTIAEGLLAEGIDTIRINGITRQDQETEPNDPAEDARYDPHAAYNVALTAVKGVWKEIQRGRIPNSAEVVAVVDTMVEMAIQDPSTLLCLSMIKDYDNYTFTHCVNVGVLSLALAAALGASRSTLRDTGVAGMLHDIGKIRIDKNILNKPGKLDAAEFEQIKKHSEFGAKIVENMQGLNDEIVQAVLGHHILFNRGGYPEWAQKIPFSEMADILAVSDTYDAITTLRPYTLPQTPKAAVDIMRKLSGTKLNSYLVEKFVEMMGDYPVGTLVRLDNNELAVVFRPNPADSKAPTVKVVIDAAGNFLEEPRIERLAQDGTPCYAAVVAVANPLTRNIDPARYLT